MRQQIFGPRCGAALFAILLPCFGIIVIAGFAREVEATVSETEIWLKDSRDPRTLEWVNLENRKTLDSLEGTGRYRALFKASQTISSPERNVYLGTRLISSVILKNYFLKIEGGKRGDFYLTRSQIADFETMAARAERVSVDTSGRDFGYVEVSVGTCAPSLPRCLLVYTSLDANTFEFREFDFAQLEFPKGGFIVPAGRSTSVQWVDDNTLLVNRNSAIPAESGSSAREMALHWETMARSPGAGAVPPEIHALSDSTGIALENWGATPADPFVIGWRAKAGSRRDYFVRIGSQWQPVALPDHPYRGLSRCGTRLFASLNKDSTVGEQAFQETDLLSFNLQDIRRGILKPSLISSDALQGGTSFFRVKGGCYLLSYQGPRPLLYFLNDQSSNYAQRVQLSDYFSIKVLAGSELDDALIIKAGDIGRPWSTFVVRKGRATKVSKKRDKTNIIAITRYAQSADGTKIPYTIFTRSDIWQHRSGEVPTIVTGYGGFGTPPSFEYNAHIQALWINNGGAFIVASLRGGGEFRNWRTRGATRQRVYDDMAAVLRAVSSSDLTSERHTGIWGQSNGGLLTAIMATQHPEFIKAAVAAAPPLDLLDDRNARRYEYEYGDLSNEEDRIFLTKTSPFNNISGRLNRVRPMILIASDDNSVIPAESRAFAAALNREKIDYYFYEFSDGGHLLTSGRDHGALYYSLVMAYFWERLASGTEGKRM
jgi:prolyl oligopeptidase